MGNRKTPSLILPINAFVIICTLTGCCKYLHNRGNDLADCATVMIERCLVGGKIEVGPFAFGLFYAGMGHDASEGIGIQGRSFFSGFVGSYVNQEKVFIAYHKRALFSNDSRKTLLYESIPPFPCYGIDSSDNGAQWNKVAARSLSAELAFGLYYGLRVGINMGEGVDLALGVIGFDILQDDDKNMRRSTREIERPVQKPSADRKIDNASCGMKESKEK